MARVDLHTHTRFFHGFNSRPTWFDPVGARLLVDVARLRGLDAIAVTNHDYFEEFDLDTGELTVIPGIEISTTLGHVLVVGPDPPTATKPGAVTPSEAVTLAHERGCAAIVAHPFRNSTVASADAEFDAIEVNGKRSCTVERLQYLAEELNVPLVGGERRPLPVRSRPHVHDCRCRPRHARRTRRGNSCRPR